MKVLYFGSYSEIYPRNRLLIDGLRENGVTVMEVQDRSRFGLKFVKLFFAHWKYRHKYDFMIVGFPGFTSMPLARAIATAPVVFDAFLSMYDSNVFDRKVCRPGSLRAKYYFFLDKFACQLADIVLLDTNAHINYFVNTFHLDALKFRRIFIGAHDKVFKPLDKLPATSYQLQALFWGWIIPLHGVEYILEAANLLRNDNIKFTFIGGGALKGKMMELKAKLNLPNVTFLPAVKAEELERHIRACDIALGIFGATEKTGRVIPNKVYEALASRRAIVTAGTPAARETLVDREHVLFCRGADGRDLAAKILELKNNPDLRERLAGRGYELYREKFTPKALGQELLNILLLF